MNCSMSLRGFLAATCLVFVSACQQQPMLGGGDSGQPSDQPLGTGSLGSGGTILDNSFRDPVNFSSTGMVTGSGANLFGADDVWSIAMPTGILTGYGTRMDYASLFTTEEDGNCVAIEPNVRIDLNGTELTISSEHTAVTGDRSCGWLISADVADCDLLDGPRTSDDVVACTLMETEGEFRRGGNRGEISQGGIALFERCDADRIALPLFNDVAILNVHPFAAVLVDDPADIGGLALLAVRNGRLASAGLLTRLVDDAPTFDGCEQPSPVGTFSFSAGRLMFDIPLDGARGVDGCTMAFDGQATYCGVIDPASTGQAGERATIIRFDGTGQWTADNQVQDMPTMFMTLGSQVPVRQ